MRDGLVLLGVLLAGMAPSLATADTVRIYNASILYDNFDGDGGQIWTLSDRSTLEKIDVHCKPTCAAKAGGDGIFVFDNGPYGEITVTRRSRPGTLGSEDTR